MSFESERQPVHTVYGGAHLFKAETASNLATTALETMRAYAIDKLAQSGELDAVMRRYDARRDGWVAPPAVKTPPAAARETLAF